MTKILLTGATGFLGSHIAESLVSKKVEVFALKRENSNCWRCENFYDKITWINYDDQSVWKEVVIKSRISIIIHAAWLGVEAFERDDLEVQAKNIDLIAKLLEIGKTLKIKKFISLGSQAEYGQINNEIDENAMLKPTTAYGVIKVASSEIVKSFCIENNIQWFWLRIFSVFGEREGNSWLIPSLIFKIKEQTSMDFTAGMQKHAYMYVKDFVAIMNKVIGMNVVSGVYNVCSNETSYLKDVIQKIAYIVNPEFKLNFGAIPYRNSQSMHIQGNMMKLFGQIGVYHFSDFNTSIDKTINYYISSTPNL